MGVRGGGLQCQGNRAACEVRAADKSWSFVASTGIFLRDIEEHYYYPNQFELVLLLVILGY